MNTRWAWGLQTQAKGKYSRMLTLGQQLNLPKFQWYFDYMGAFDDLDRLKIATNELGGAFVDDEGNALGNVYLGKVHYTALSQRPTGSLLQAGT